MIARTISCRLGLLCLLPLVACVRVDAADTVSKAVSAGDNGTVSFSNLEVKFAADTMELTVTPASGRFQAGSAKVVADAAATWTVTTNTETTAVFDGVVGALDDPKKGKVYNPTYSGQLKTTGGSGGGAPPVWNLTGKYQTFKVEIADETGTVLKGSVPAVVAVKRHYVRKITPTTLSGVTFQWKIDGSTTPPRTVAIKTYAQSIVTGPTPTDLAAADLTSPNLDLFWTDVGSRTLRLEATYAGHMDFAEVTIVPAQDPDPNRNIYARYIADVDEDHNPGLYGINDEHDTWHTGHDPALRSSAYKGDEFFSFHQVALSTAASWKALFHVPPPTFNNPGIPEPTYLLAAGGGTESPIYGYVRLGEYENLDQLGDETVSPWHNQGHGFLAGTVDPDMGSPSTAIHGKENIFWRWHTRVDNVRAAFRPDKAALASTTPADKAIIKARPAVFVATFASPVSVTPASTEPALNTAQITAGLLTVNGVPATGVTKSADHKTVTFTVAMPASGPVTVAFAGTRSVDSFATSFTITP